MIIPKKYQVIKRKVKYLRLEIKDEKLRVIVPKNYQGKVEELIKAKSSWIEKKLKLINEIKKQALKYDLVNQINLKEIIENQIKKISLILKIKPKSISFRSMKKRWGSCSNDGKIIFNKILKFLPDDLIFYVVAHEMSHLLIKNHKKEFWLLLKKLVPDFLEKEKLLAVYKIKINQYKNFKKLSNFKS